MIEYAPYALLAAFGLFIVYKVYSKKKAKGKTSGGKKPDIKTNLK